MEFKGTKGKWEVCKTHKTITDYKGFTIAKEYGIRNSNEWKANALLMSKAPEMLEMLEWILSGQNIDNSEIEQLIKEATEI